MNILYSILFFSLPWRLSKRTCSNSNPYRIPTLSSVLLLLTTHIFSNYRIKGRSVNANLKLYYCTVILMRSHMHRRLILWLDPSPLRKIYVHNESFSSQNSVALAPIPIRRCYVYSYTVLYYRAPVCITKRLMLFVKNLLSFNYHSLDKVFCFMRS